MDNYKGFTPEQIDAITMDNNNIIVSAGAGSGKTTVLTKRVIRKLLEGTHINELLILTFTNNAAKHMKNKIREKIKNESSLKEELNLIDSAYITTFDSFAMSIVKKYHYLLNITPSIEVAPESLIKIKKEEILDDILNDLYKVEDKKFSKLIKDFCVKDDENIRDSILKIDDKLDLKPNKIEFIKDIDCLNINESISDFEKLLISKINEIKDLLNELSYEIEEDAFGKIKESLINLITKDAYNEIKDNLNISMPNLPNGSSDKAKSIKKKITDTKNELIKLCKYQDIDEIKRYIDSTKDYIEVIKDILIKLNERLDEYKFKNDLYTFNDIAKLSIKIVNDYDYVKEEIKSSFKEIMIDEYQDTNDLEEELISLISDNNVYMVGDIKQSIYRFRNANPYIFKRKYDLYRDNKHGIKIDLNKNFRSREEVLNNINKIFTKIMTDDFGGCDYINDGFMTFGKEDYNTLGKSDQNNDMEIFNYIYEKGDTFKREEIEAFIISNDIKDKVKNGYKVFDKDTGKFHDARYDDFTILMDRSTNFELYKKIFEYNGVPLTIYKDERITEDIVIELLKNLLLLIISIHDEVFDSNFKHYFISVMRSPLIEESDTNIFKFFKDNNFSDSSLYKKCLELSSKMDNYSNKEFINLVIDEFNFYENMIKLGSVGEYIVKIEYLVNLVDSFSNLGYNIKEFTKYLDDLINKDENIRFSLNKEEKDNVSIMTIHGSKGLEFNICYFSGLDVDFNIRDVYERFVYSDKYGIITPIFDEGIDSTIYRELYRNNYLKEEISEKIRLFYVALTRAKCKMIFVTDNYDTINNSSDWIKLSYKSFKDMLVSVNLNSYVTNIDINSLNISKDYNLIKNKNYLDYIDKVSDKLDIKEINIPNKVLKKETYSKRVNKLISKSEKENMVYGSKIHRILEEMDFKCPNYDGLDIDLKNKISNLINKLDLDCDIYKEYEFMDIKDNKINHGIIDLMLVYDNKVNIIDYKLKNIDDENYIKQLNGYREYISKKLNKETNCYLYSIIDDSLLEIK